MMVRYTGILILGLAAIANLSAGSLTFVGGPNGLTSTQTYGNITGTELPLSGALLQGTATNGTSITSGVACIGVAATSAANCTGGGGTLATSLPYTGSNPAGGEYLTSGTNNITFAMINESTNSEWTTSGTANTTSTITIPIGIFGVQNVYTLMNDYFGIPGGKDITVTFNFGATANGSTTATEAFNLVDGTVIRDSWYCTGGATGNGCLAYQSSGVDPLNTTNMYDQTGASLGAITTTATPNVSAFNVITSSYGTTVGGNAKYAGTSGNIYLDGQNFYLGTDNIGKYLTSITVSDTTTASAQSKAQLFAVTLNVATPEPGTWILLLSAIGAAVLVRRRQSARGNSVN